MASLRPEGGQVSPRPSRPVRRAWSRPSVRRSAMRRPSVRRTSRRRTSSRTVEMRRRWRPVRRRGRRAMRGRTMGRRRRRRKMAMVLVDPIAPIGRRRIPPAQVPPIAAVPASPVVVAVDVVANERVGDAVENVGEKRIRCGEGRRRHDGGQNGAQQYLSSCQHVTSSQNDCLSC